MEYRSDALNRCLAMLHRNAPGVRGSAVITTEGLVIAAYPPGWDDDIHAEAGGANVAAMAAVVAGQADTAMARLGQGALEQVILEGANGTVGILPATGEWALALLVDKSAKLGLTFQAARKTILQIRSILDLPA